MAKQDAIALLKADHRKVEELFEKYESARGKKADIAQQICLELTVHTMIEEEIFYPACREAGVESDMMDEANVEHDGAKALIAELEKGTARGRILRRQGQGPVRGDQASCQGRGTARRDFRASPQRGPGPRCAGRADGGPQKGADGGVQGKRPARAGDDHHEHAQGPRLRCAPSHERQHQANRPTGSRHEPAQDGQSRRTRLRVSSSDNKGNLIPFEQRTKEDHERAKAGR